VRREGKNNSTPWNKVFRGENEAIYTIYVAAALPMRSDARKLRRPRIFFALDGRTDFSGAHNKPSRSKPTSTSRFYIFHGRRMELTRAHIHTHAKTCSRIFFAQMMKEHTSMYQCIEHELNKSACGLFLSSFLFHARLPRAHSHKFMYTVRGA